MSKKIDKFVKDVIPKPPKPKLKNVSVRVPESVATQLAELKQLIKQNTGVVDVDVNGLFAASVEKDIKEITEAVQLKIQQSESTKGRADPPPVPGSTSIPSRELVT